MARVTHCPRCRSERVTDGSSRPIAVLGALALVGALAALLLLCPAHQVDDWTQFTTLENHDWRALPVLALGILMIWGGSRHPDGLFCTKCGYKWVRYHPPKVQLRPNNHRPH